MHKACLPAKVVQKPVEAVTGLHLLVLGSLMALLYSNIPHAVSQSSSQGQDPSRTDEDSSVKTQKKLGQGQPFSKPYGYYLNPILDHIKASQDQRLKITMIVQSYRGRIQPMTVEYKQKNHEFLSNVAHGRPPEIIMDEQTRLGRLYSDITLSYCQMSLEVRKVLTPEQIVRYEEFRRQQGWASPAKSSDFKVESLEGKAGNK